MLAVDDNLLAGDAIRAAVLPGYANQSVLSSQAGGDTFGAGGAPVGTHGYILATWVKAIGRALDAAGCNGTALLTEAGYELRDLEGPTARCPLVNSGRMWELAVAATGDVAFGLKVASHIKHTTFHALSYGLCASSTLKEAFERVQRYCHVGSDAISYELSKHDREYHVVIKTLAVLPFEPIDALVAAQLRMCRSLSGRDFSPLSIELQRPLPAKLQDFERLLRAPITFGASQNRLVFDAAGFERPLEGGNPELARHNDVIALQFLTRIERDDFHGRVREVLVQRLEGREPSQEEVAERLHVSPRTLQRKLVDCGTSYKTILDDTRRALALAYLSAPERSVNEITWLLGFSSASCFSRAFRRWTGLPPSLWRAAAVSHREMSRAARPKGGAPLNPA